MNVLLLWLCFLIDTHALFTPDSDCGKTKGCYSDCGDDGTTFLISWTSDSTAVNFTIQVELSSNADQYGAVGLSTSPQSMGDTSVTSCLMTNSNSAFTVQNSYNTGRTNTPIAPNPTDGLSGTTGSYIGNLFTCSFARTIANSNSQVFNLNNDYYILYARGTVSGGNTIQQHAPSGRSFSAVKVDLQSLTNVCAGVDMRVKAHGCIAIIAWMILANLGYFIARYYKPLWSSKKVFGSDIWFLIHRVLMVSAAVLTIISFGVIIQGKFTVGSNSFERSHPYIGIIVFCFVIINPIIGLLRPDKQSKYRPVFYWVHYCIGAGVLILGLINIFIGIRLEEADTSNQAYYVFLGYESFQIAMIVVLEVLKYIEGKKAKNVESDREMKAVHSDGVADKEETKKDKEDLPYAWTAKLILLCVHVIVTVILPLAVVGIVATSTSSTD